MLNLLTFNSDALKSTFQRFQYLIIAVLFSLVGLMPIVLQRSADALTLTNRKVTISTSKASQTGVSYAFNFTMATGGGTVQSIAFSFCTTALGTCTLPAGMVVDRTTTTTNATQTFTSTSPAFTEYAGADAGACTDADSGAAATQYCVSRTNATTETAAAKAITIDAVTNPSLSGNTTAVYVRISLYSDAAFATLVDNGTVAAAIVRQITVNGRVAERLDFCVGAVTDSDAGAPDSTEDASITGLTDNGICTGSFPSTATIDIGVLDDTAVYFSPVNTTATNGALDNYGLAAVKTNAANGVNVSLYAENATSVSGGDTDHLKAFRVVPTDCQATQTSGAGLLDQCFKSASNAAISAGTETFGLKLACFYQGTTFSTTSALAADATYADAATTSAADCENTTDNTNYNWDETGVADTLASSTGVVDDELIKFEFGATTSSTTPTGNYTVVSTYIATPTF